MEETPKISSNNKNKLYSLLHFLPKAAQYDLSSHSIIRLSGTAAKTFLQSQITSDIDDITAQRAGLSAICNNKGRVLSVFTLLQHGQDYLLIFPNNNHQTVLDQLKKYGHFSKVSITTDSHNYQHLGVVLNDIPKNFPKNNYDVVNIDNWLVLKLPSMGNRFECFGINSQAYTGALPIDSIPIEQLHSWRAMEIAAGIPIIEDVATAMYTPHMLNLQILQAISFTKGCYIGQEIIARTEHKGQVKRSALLGILNGVKSVQPGDEIFDQDHNPVGNVVVSVFINNDQKLVLLVIPKVDQTIPLFDQHQQELSIIEKT